MFYTNEKLISYSKYLSPTEKNSCESSINVVKNILKNDGFLISRENNYSTDDDLNFGFVVSKDNVDYTVLLQGSYGIGTCVKQDSDVDISIICETNFRGKYNLYSKQDYGFIDSSYSILDFKEYLVNLINKSYNGCAFSNNKCIDFKGNGTSRKNIDIVPSLRYRDYTYDFLLDCENYIKGICIVTKDGQSIINYPEQSRDNSINKNKRTNFYYKKVVRILKKIKIDMEENEISESFLVSSFGLECLVYNVPDYIIDGNYSNIRDRIIKILLYLNKNEDLFISFKETNGILNLFDNPKNNINTYKSFIEKMWSFFE